MMTRRRFLGLLGAGFVMLAIPPLRLQSSALRRVYSPYSNVASATTFGALATPTPSPTPWIADPTPTPCWPPRAKRCR